MGPEDKRAIKRFTLSELGVLHGPPLKGAVVVAEMTREVLRAESAAFIVFDVMAGEALVRAGTRGMRIGTIYPLHLSAIASLQDDVDTIAIGDISRDAPQSGERANLGMVAALASRVLGPDGNPVGALTAFDSKPRIWSALQKRWMADLAYLITQELMLYASFATLEIMAEERKSRPS